MKTHIALLFSFSKSEVILDSRPAYTNTHMRARWCLYLKSLRPTEWYKCHTHSLWSDQQTAHQQHTVILISRVLLRLLPPVNQTLSHICRRGFD